MKKLFTAILLLLSISVFAQSYDAFGRLRISEATNYFDGQLVYDLQPLLFWQNTDANTAITHDATNHAALLTMTNALQGEDAIFETLEDFHYQAGKSQYAAITFNMNGGRAGVQKSVGYTDGTNGVEFVSRNDSLFFILRSSTGHGIEEVYQKNWSVDRMDGSYNFSRRRNPSKITLSDETTLILEIDIQALYSGRVRVGFNIDGIFWLAHEFNHSNVDKQPYIWEASLPIQARILALDTTVTSDTLTFICSTVATEGGIDNAPGFKFSQSGSVTAADGVWTHAITLQPDSLFQGRQVNGKLVIESVELLVTGSSPVQWAMVRGATLTGTTTFTAQNTTYSIAEYNKAGVLSGTPPIFIESGYVGASNQVKGFSSFSADVKAPICRNPDNTERTLNRPTLIVKGIGGASALQYTINWKELR